MELGLMLLVYTLFKVFSYRDLNTLMVVHFKIIRFPFQKAVVLSHRIKENGEEGLRSIIASLLSFLLLPFSVI